jgi:hypothetical protein
LEGHIYDFTGERMPDQFIKMTKEMKNYVGWTYTKYTADFASGKGNLQMIKKTPHFLLNFLQISTIFASFSRAHAGTLQNPSIHPCATTLQKNSVESSSIFYGNLMLCINWFY